MTKRALAALFTVILASAALAQIQPDAKFATGGPSTTDNDDTCDVGVFPAATLLLPYFEVDTAGGGETTLFTVTNTTNLPQVARVTIWTDYSLPIVHFNVYLTGYDVQSINLFDVIVNGILAPPNGTGTSISPVGSRSAASNPVVPATGCGTLPGVIPAALVTRIQSALTTGNVAGGCATSGSNHPGKAIGYVTVDVTGACGDGIPSDPSYHTSEVRFDNVLIGDYQQVNATSGFARGSEMVHIRAMPEGGTPSTRIGPAFVNNFPRTFYFRYATAKEPRQPLPSQWAARWVSGGASGFSTRFKIWREGATSGTTACSAYPILGGQISAVEIVRFDEDENPEGTTTTSLMRSTSSIDVDDATVFPPNTTGAVGGWMYLNLARNTAAPQPSQSWVTVSMAAANVVSVDFDAAALGNGCTPPANAGVTIGPAANLNPNP